MTIELAIEDYKRITAVCAGNVASAKNKSSSVLLQWHPSATRICIKVFPFGEEGKVEAVGLDHASLAIAYAACKILSSTPEEMSAVCHTYLVEPCKAMTKGASHVQITDGEAGSIKLTFDNGTSIVQPAAEGNVFDYQKIIDANVKKECTLMFTVDPALMIRVLEGMKDGKRATMWFTDCISPCIIDTEHARALIFPMRAGEETDKLELRRDTRGRTHE